MSDARARAGRRRSLHLGTLGLGAALAGALLVPAAAGAATTPNACRYSFDGYWRNLDVEMSGSPTPTSVAPGSGISLTGASVRAQLPTWIPEYGYNLGLLEAGENRIPARVWVAIDAAGTVEGTRYRELATTATTTIATGAGGAFASGTPIDVTVPVPAMAWTAGASGDVVFSQGPPGSLPEIAALAGGASTRPLGSLYIRAQLPNSVTFDLDCQPGRYTQSGDAFAPGIAGTIASAPIDAAAPPTPAPSAEGTGGSDAGAQTRRGVDGSAGDPGAGLLSGIEAVGRRPVAGARRVSVRLACLQATACRGAVRLRSSRRVPVDGRRRVAVLARGRYAIPPGATRTVSVSLTRVGRRLAAVAPRLRTRVELTPAAARRVVRGTVMVSRLATTTTGRSSA